jgi:hypothetical protein
MMLITSGMLVYEKKNVMLPCRFLAKGRSCSGLRGLVAFRKPFRWAAVVFIEV